MCLWPFNTLFLGYCFYLHGFVGLINSWIPGLDKHQWESFRLKFAESLICYLEYGNYKALAFF